MTTDDVPITFSRDEALVLSDWISRHISTPQFEAIVDDRAVWPALMRINGVLESSLVEIFRGDYDVLLTAARERLNAKLGDYFMNEEAGE